MDSLLEKLKAAGPLKGEPSSARKRALMRKHLLENKKTIGILSDRADEEPLVSPLDAKNPNIGSEPTTPEAVDDINHLDEKNDDQIGDRARNLLNELRGSSSNTSNGDGESAASKLRNQRFKKKLSVITAAEDDLELGPESNN